MKHPLIRFTFYTIVLLCFCFNSVRANNLLHKADSLYSHQNYSEALNQYHQLMAHDNILKADFALNFKIGICHLKNENYSEAQNIFKRLNSNKIPEYVDYFLFLSALPVDKTWSIVSKAQKFLKEYPDHFLADSVLLKLADYKFKINRFEDAYHHYRLLAGRKKIRSLKPYALSQMAFCRLNLDKKKDAMESMYQIMKKYPSDDAALKIANFFDTYQTPSEKFDFTIAEVYLKHGKYHELTARLEKFIKEASDPELKGRARYYLVQIYYQKQNYSTALYGFNNLLSNLKNTSLESRIRLYIARCYLRLDQTEEAVNGYLDYAKRYPRRRMAVESVWKAAWVYEELGDIAKALGVYQHLLKHWPRSKYRDEAKFRMGLSYFRLGNISQAEQEFQNILLSNDSDFDKSRSSYWLAKTYEKQGKIKDSERLLKSLGRDLFKNYYALKSYMLYKQPLDSLYHIKERLADRKNPLRYYKESIATLIERFEDLFLLQELLGEDIALRELSENKYYPKSLKGWISLAEIYKMLGAYNHAFKIYDYINNKHFSDLTQLEKPFLLKEAYPLYYDNIVGNYGSIRNLDKNLVMALIRAESSFNRQAHSWADAYGLMQIIPRTARALAEELDLELTIPLDLFDPDLNINLGTYYLNKLLRQFDNKPEYAAAAYNAGPHRVKRWQNFDFSEDIDFFVENVEYSQTRNYVRRVMRDYWIYLLLDQAK
jgi:soluble lytic murein transglycosylase